MLDPATCWVFFSGSLEERHALDILFAVDVLKRSNVSPGQIHIFSPHESHGFFGTSPKAKLNDCIDFKPDYFKSIEASLVIATTTGHGNHLGLAVRANGFVSPHTFLDTIRSCKNQKTAVGVICQCHAGVFNFMELTGSPEVLMIGATNFGNSISISVNPTLSDGSTVDWEANAFLVFLFAWMIQPHDVDGDGAHGVLDAFKWASVNCEMNLLGRKVSSFKAAIEKVNEIPHLTGVDQQAAEQVLKNVTSFIFNHQESWLSHAKLARKILWQ